MCIFHNDREDKCFRTRTMEGHLHLNPRGWSGCTRTLLPHGLTTHLRIEPQVYFKGLNVFFSTILIFFYFLSLHYAGEDNYLGKGRWKTTFAQLPGSVS
jgi:hypothetical protein